MRTRPPSTPRSEGLAVGAALAVHLLWLVPGIRSSATAALLVAALGASGLTVVSVLLRRREPVPGSPVPTWWAAGVTGLAAIGAVMSLQDGAAAVARTLLTVAVTAAPGAVVAAAPLTLAAVRSHARSFGIHLPDARILTNSDRIDAVLLDKHRTVTTGAMEITAVEPLDVAHHNNLLFFAGALSHGSAAPAPAAAALARRSGRGRVTGYREVSGSGMVGSVDRHPVRLGRPEWIGLTAPERGGTTLGVEVDGQALGLVTLDDVVRPQARELSAELAAIAPLTLISDRPTADTDVLAAGVGIEHRTAVATVECRLSLVKTAQDGGHRVCYVGVAGSDNDPALRQCDLAVTDAAPDADADAALRPHDIRLDAFELGAITTALQLATGTRRRTQLMRTTGGALSLVSTAIAAAGLLNAFTAAGVGLGVTATVAVLAHVVGRRA